MASPLALLLFFFLLLLRRPDPSAAAPVATEFVYPNFTASNLLFVDSTGVFLQSPAAVFQAVIASPRRQQPGNFYFSVVHVPTTTIVWSANRAAPVPDSAELVLSPTGLVLSFPNGSPVWSTPPFDGAVAAMRLADTGNLLLLDSSNATLWESFDHPTDTLLSGQPLPVGAELVSATSESNFTGGDYRMVVTAVDAMLQWNGGDQQYWSLSTDARATKDTNAAAAYLAMNGTGFYLFGAGGNRVVWMTKTLPAAALRIGKLDYKGRFTILSYALPNSSVYIDEEFVAPTSDCDLPLSCPGLGLCTPGQNTTVCSCPTGFGPGAGGCQPSDGSTLASASVCANAPSYLSLRSGISYFATKFATARMSGLDLPECRQLCSQNCSCLGFYYRNSSGSCFLLQNQLGSLTKASDAAAATATDLGFVKVVPGSSPSTTPGKGNSTVSLLPIVLPSIAVFLLLVLLVVVFIRCRLRQRKLRRSSMYSAKDIKLGRRKSGPSTRSEEDEGEEEEEISIPGLPTRFTYEELEAATKGFRTRIGSGGFGEVYKGVLPDETTVAVKRITSLGVQGKREFCTEMAVIGNIHHVNLVKLRGFCVQGSKRLLVYEYMNRGSLDRSLFAAGGSPVLEWGERLGIALGTARGLAYLHGGCDHKIIHCDVKPENILLSDPAQVKISDFGLSKLLAPEQSALFTTMRGTRGYLAPEWLTSSAISDRTDVYSYGMVLLEIVRGRKNCVVLGPTDDSELLSAGRSSSSGGVATSSGSSGAGGRVYFPMHALEMQEQGRYLELADPRLEGRVEAAEVEKVVRVALCCLHEEPALRPSMAAVVGMLEGTVPVWAPRSDSLNFLRFYGRGFEARPDAAMAAAMGGAGEAVGHGGFYGRGNYGASATSTGSTTSTSQSYTSAHHLSGPR